MQTRLAAPYRNTAEGIEAESILRSCVHCGFCLATCPTYQLLGNELDSPRGRIYLIKQVLEGSTPSAQTLLHLDRCLSCRACETTCPSGVRYGRLLDIGRELVARQTGRPSLKRWQRQLLIAGLRRPRLFKLGLAIGQHSRPILQGLAPALAEKIPLPVATINWQPRSHPRKMILHEGCVQPGLAPSIHLATRRLLDACGIEAISPPPQCCGALAHHLGDSHCSHDDMRRLIDTVWPLIEAGAEALVSTASGCGAMLADYATLLQDDPAYADKARRLHALFRDISDVLRQELPTLQARLTPSRPGPIVFQAPCSLQHALRRKGKVEALLTELGYTLLPVADAHLCCGSAGTYSLLQPEIATALRRNKLGHLLANQPCCIATANIGCMQHLQAASPIPVRHWVELVAEAL